MNIALIATGFTIGIAGSFHCVGMCGPIALALPLGNAGKWERILYSLIYNFGRITTYLLMGGILGWAGSNILSGKYQQYLSISIGVLILLYLIFSKWIPFTGNKIATLTFPVKQKLSKLLRENSNPYTFWLIGFLNGFLPCGLVYAAIAGALATGSAVDSALWMAAFGIGTIPAMLLVTVAGKMISLKWRNQIQKAVPYMVAAMAVLFILRGMNLGIPYISPQYNEDCHRMEKCCHP